MYRAHASRHSSSHHPPRAWLRQDASRGLGISPWASGAFQPTTELSEESGSVLWTEALAASLSFLAHATVGHSDTSSGSPQGRPQLPHTYQCTHLPPLLSRCVCPSPAGHPGCTGSWHAYTCMLRPSRCPGPFCLHPATSIARGSGDRGADSQRYWLRSGRTTSSSPSPHVPCTQAAFGVYLVPFEHLLFLCFLHFP